MQGHQLSESKWLGKLETIGVDEFPALAGFTRFGIQGKPSQLEIVEIAVSGFQRYAAEFCDFSSGQTVLAGLDLPQNTPLSG